MGRGRWQATVHGVAKSQTQLNMQSCNGYHVCDAKQTCIVNKGELMNYNERERLQQRTARKYQWATLRCFNTYSDNMG